MSGIERFLKVIAGFLTVLSVSAFIYISFLQSTHPKDDEVNLKGEKKTPTASEISASKDKRNYESTEGVLRERPSSNAGVLVNPDAVLEKKGILRKIVKTDANTSDNKLKKILKKELKSLASERKINGNKFTFMIAFVIIQDSEGKELARGVIRPDGTFAIAISGKVEEGFIDEL